MLVAPAGLQPALRGGEQGGQDLGVVLELQEAEHPRLVAVVGVPGLVDLRADAPHDAAVAPGQEQLGVAVLEERVEAPVQEQAPLDPQRGDPVLRGRVQAVRELDELAQLPPARHGPHVHGHRRHGTCPRLRSTSSRRPATPSASLSCAPRARRRSSRTSARSRARRSPSSRWRAPRGSCWAPTTTSGSRAIRASTRRPARRWTPTAPGLTGSRLLNGTTQLHLDLERELAEWMGTEDAIVFTTGHQANVGTLGTILAPGDTVIADSADHASILDGCLLAGPSCARSATGAWRSSRRPSSAPRATAAASWSSSTACSRWRATSPSCPRSPTSAAATARG